MNRRPHVRATITYLTTEEGGRQTPVFSGYQGQFHYQGEHDTGWLAVQYFSNRESVNPGDSVDCEIWFGTPEMHFHPIALGTRFHVQEGGRVVGNGIITEILRRDDSGAA